MSISRPSARERSVERAARLLALLRPPPARSRRGRRAAGHRRVPEGLPGAARDRAAARRRATPERAPARPAARPIRASRSRQQQIAAIADADARENWELMVAFRDHLARHRTLEAAYLDIVRRNLKFPHLFLNQLVHVILRNALDGCERPLRAARRRAVLPAAEAHPARGLAGGCRRGDRLGPGRQAAVAAGVDAGLAGGRRDRCAQRGQRRRLLGAQRPVRHGARSHGRPARARRAGRGRRALDCASAGRRGRRSSRWSRCRMSP